MPRSPVVHIIDDDRDVLKSLGFLMAAHDLPYRTYDAARSFLDILTLETAGCILSDVRMPGMDGLELLSRVRAHGVFLPFIVMTGHGDIPLAVRAMKQGATDFIEKPFGEKALLNIVMGALEVDRQNEQREIKARDARERLSLLTTRETQILELVATGLSSKVIAYQLDLSARTVDVHRANILSKLNVDNAISAVALLVEGRPTASLQAHADET